MRKTAILVTTLLTASAATLQEPSDGTRLVEAWFDAVSALDGSEASIERLVSLYLPDALHVEGPAGEHQRGTVTFEGAANIRTMAGRVCETYERIVYRIESVTANETSATLFHRADGPWGGEAVAVQYWAAYTRRADGVRLTHPGAAFFQIQSGKIRRLRLYASDGERAEVEPLP